MSPETTRLKLIEKERAASHYIDNTAIKHPKSNSLKPQI